MTQAITLPVKGDSRRMTVTERAAYYGLVGAIVAAALAAVAAVYKTFKDNALAAKNAELSELREFRQELRQEVAHLRERQNELERRLSQATAEIQEQRGHFVGILFRLEGIMAIQDAQIIATHVSALVSHIRQLLDMPIGEPERRLQFNRLEPVPEKGIDDA